jgi:thermitase
MRICRSNRARLLRTALLALAFSASAATAAPPELGMRIDGDRIWLVAEQAPLRDILHRFVDLGIDVYVDPAIDRQITARHVDQPIDDVLNQLLDDHSYFIIYSPIKGPLGDLYQLSEIMVFAPGQPGEAMPRLTSTNALIVKSLPDGSEYIADELVLGFAPNSDQDAARALLHDLQGTLVDSVPEMGLYRVRLPPGSDVPALVARLRDNPLVADVEPNYAYRLPPPLPPADDDATPRRNPVRLPPLGAPPVAVLDSGLANLPDLSGFVLNGYNALDPNAPYDDQAGHGTQMALIAAGVIQPNGAAAAAGVPVLAIRAFDDDGVTSNFAQMRSIFYAASQGTKVMNLSWGSPAHSPFLEEAVERAQQSGLLVVAAAGNEGTTTAMYPAAYASVLGVAATQADGTPWPLSNSGDMVFLSAPGTAHFPAVADQARAGGYAGTSIAAATVSHVLGRYFALHPQATPLQAAAALQDAVRQPDQPWNPQTGYGVLTPAAVDALLD